MKVDGALLKEARERVFMSPEELAEALSLNLGVVVGLEAAARTEVKENLAGEIAQILFVARSDLTDYPNPPRPVEVDRRPEDLGYDL